MDKKANAPNNRKKHMVSTKETCMAHQLEYHETTRYTGEP